MNTIKISEEEARRIVDYYKEKDPKTVYENNFVFEKFALCIGKSVKMNITANEGNRDIKIQGFIAPIEIGGMWIEFLVEMKDMKRHMRLFPKTDFEKNFIANHQDELKEQAKGISEWAFISMHYIMNYPRERKQTRVSSLKYSREYRLSTKQNRIYLFSDILKYVSDTYVPESQHHSIQCPCWEVRGHYRHYKSGKVVFIPSYRKGKQRDTAKPKDKEYYA